MSFVPHFDLPFRIGSNHHAATVEQDTVEDISNCVRAILLTHIGERIELPSFGTPELTFGRQPLQIGLLIDAILEQEPRAAIHMEQSPDKFEAMVARILVEVSAREETSV